MSDNPMLEAWLALLDKLPADKIYQQGLEPGVIEIGKVFGTLGRVVNAALAPVNHQAWMIDEYYKFLRYDVPRRLENVPPENFVEPPLLIAGPIIENVKYAFDEPEFRAMYANLLARAMNSKEAENVHPSYAKVLSEVSLFDVRLLNILSEEYEPVNGTHLIQLRPTHKFARTFLLAFTYRKSSAEDINPDEIPVLIDPREDNYRMVISNLERLGLVVTTDLVASDEDDGPQFVTAGNVAQRQEERLSDLVGRGAMVNPQFKEIVAEIFDNRSPSMPFEWKNHASGCRIKLSPFGMGFMKACGE